MRKQTELTQPKFWITNVTWQTACCPQRLDQCPLCRAGLKAAIRAKREAGEEVEEALEGLFQTIFQI